MQSFHGGDVFLLSLLAHSGVVPTMGRQGPWEGSICGFLVGVRPSVCLFHRFHVLRAVSKQPPRIGGY
jgi:hypothetical protein